MTVIKQMRNSAALAALAVGHSVAMAQSIVITYGPVDVASVPTLSEWGMIITAVLLAGAAVYAMRKNAGSKTVMSIVFLSALTSGTTLGHKYISEASAAPGGMTVATGSTLSIPLSGTPTSDFPVYNDTSPGVPLKIISVQPAEAVQGAQSPACTPGSIVAAGSFCYVKRFLPG